MVARINLTAKFSAVLQYNEKKVAQNKAGLIHAKGFLQEKNRMTIPEKMQRFARLHELNPRSEVNTLHISLNFHPSEKLSDQQMADISDRYMQGLGLQDQPYLVYRHEDASHPHLHIVSSLIRPDGKRVRTEKIGKNLSEPIRKTIETEFQLIPTGRNSVAPHSIEIEPDLKDEHTTRELQKVSYGDGTRVKTAMQTVLETVNREYVFTSLTEYNAILRQYNMMANAGKEGSLLQQHGGLRYHVLNDQGKRVGHYLKASLFPNKPTLSHLQTQFEENKQRQQEHLPSVRQKIDWVLIQSPGSLHEFAHALRKDNVEVVVHQEEKEPHFTYIDNDNKISITGASLGKTYTAVVLSKTIPGANLSQSATQAQEVIPQIKVPQLLSAIISPEPSDENQQQQVKQKR